MPRYMYATGRQADAVVILDVTDPTNLIVAASISGVFAPNFLGDPYGLSLSNNYLYVCCDLASSLTVIDVSNPLVPTYAGRLNHLAMNMWGPFAPFIVGDMCYLCGRVEDSLSCIDITNPVAPVILGQVVGAGAPNWLNGAHLVKVVGTTAYVVSYYDNSFGIFDVSNPAAPFVLGVIRGAGAPNFLDRPSDFEIRGNYAFVAAEDDDSLTVIDITNPAAPAFVMNISGAGWPNWMWQPECTAIKDDYLYVATYNRALNVIDITNPAAPVLVATLRGGGGVPPYLFSPLSMAIRGNYIYVGKAWPTDPGITVIDISDPLSPTYVSHITDGILDACFGVFASPVVAPTITTNVATEVSHSEAKLHGTLSNDGNDDCSVCFEWGYTPAMGIFTTWKTGYLSGQTFPEMLTGLHSTVYFRAVGRNAGGTSYGPTLFFTTPSEFPQVITLIASAIAENHATLNGYLQEDAGRVCEVKFEWGASRSYGMETPGQGGVSEGTSFLAAITGLTPGVLYHCRALVSYWGLVYYGNDVSFTTLPLGHMMTLVAPELTTDL